jgi:hypothetical protein
MDQDRAHRDELDAQIREADARLDQLEAHARANKANEEMDDVSGLRDRREHLQERLTNAKTRGGEAWDDFRRGAQSEWQDFRRSIDDAHHKYSAWDAARERRFNARIDEANALLMRWSAQDDEVAAELRIEISKVTQDLQRKSRDAQHAYDAWRDQRSDDRLQRRLDDAERDLDAAYRRVETATSDLDQERRE